MTKNIALALAAVLAIALFKHIGFLHKSHKKEIAEHIQERDACLKNIATRKLQIDEYNTLFLRLYANAVNLCTKSKAAMPIGDCLNMIGWDAEMWEGLQK